MVDCYEYPISSVSNTSNYKHKIHHIECLEERLQNAGGCVDLSGYVTLDCLWYGYARKEHTHSGYSLCDHSHSGYSLCNHTHSGYSLCNHTHSNYSLVGHTHDYAARNHDHNYLCSCALSSIMKLCSQVAWAYCAIGRIHEYLKTMKCHIVESPPCFDFFAFKSNCSYQKRAAICVENILAAGKAGDSTPMSMMHENTIISE